MECNKEEAIRARDLAELKMKNSDFDGARKIALKAQNLHPELENISQLLSICNVHCSAQQLVLSEKDWYGVLQVERFADELAIKKQYRRLALILHPDKNRFPGAEAAFKLICEANAVLSDPRLKSLYDNRIKVRVGSSVCPPPHHVNKTSHFNKQYGAGIKIPNGFHSMNQHQATRTSFSVRQDMFCTSCPFCGLKYQLDRKYVNTNVHCQKCQKTFISLQMSGQGVPLESKCAPESSQKVPVKPGMSQYSTFQENGIPNQGGNRMGVQNGKGFSSSHTGSRPTAPGVRMESIFKDKGAGCAAKVSVGVKSKRKDSGITSEYVGEVGRTCNGNQNNREEGNRKNKKKGRRRKASDESSDSFDTSSESDLEDVIVVDSGVTTNLKSGPTRRSSRKRQNVSYKEGEDDDDDYDLPRSQKGSKLSEGNGNRQNDVSDGESMKHGNQNGLPADADYSKSEGKERGTVYPEEIPQDKDSGHDKGVEANGAGGGLSNIGVDANEMEAELDGDAFSGDDSNDGLQHFEDPEFYDFDKDRDASCFAVNQYWSCYDSVDGMPRFYCKVKNICVNPFEVCISWLEAQPADATHKIWVDMDLPVSCGNFKVGDTQKISTSFSHQVHCEKGKRGSLIIHPRRGEVWAIFKDWDLSWCYQPESHRDYIYEIVEVLSDFDAVAGVRVCYLDKVGGFVSLFQRSSQSTTDSFMIRPNELYRVSHSIPSFKMSGSEREGVPIGSLELDPAALPQNPDKLYYPGKSTDDTGPGVNCSPPKSDLGKDNFMKSKTSNPKNFVDLECSD